MRSYQFPTWESGVSSVLRKDSSPVPWGERRGSSLAKAFTAPKGTCPPAHHNQRPSIVSGFLLIQSTVNSKLCPQTSRGLCFQLFSRLWQSLLTPSCIPVCGVPGTFLWKGKEWGRGSPMSIVVYALKWAHAVPSHVLLAIMKCPVNVLVENWLLNPRREFHKARISHLSTPSFLFFFSACNGVKSFQIRDLMNLLPF